MNIYFNPDKICIGFCVHWGENMIAEITNFEKNFRKLASIVKKIEKMTNDLQKNAFLIEGEIKKFEKFIRDFDGISELLKKMEQRVKEIAINANSEKEKLKGLFFVEVEKGISPIGLNLKGNFPSFTCGILTIESPPEGKGDVKIYFGPKVSYITKCKMDSNLLAITIKKIYSDLEKTGLNEDKFLSNLYSAYSRVLKLNNGLNPRLPIGKVLSELSFIMQKKEFLNNPLRENFTSYGRMQFAYDISRLNKREIGELRLKLTVASIEQTKNPDTNLWVPLHPRSERGTHFSMIEFIKKEQGEECLV